MRINQISLNLLQNQEQNHKPERLHRIHREDQERPHNTADKRAENRDQRCHGDQHTDRERIGKPQDAHGEEKHAAKDHRLQALAGQEAGKRAVGERSHLCDAVRMMLRQKRIEKLAELAAQPFLLQKDIGREHDRHHAAHYTANDGRREVQCGIEHAAHAVLREIDKALRKLFPVDRNPAEHVHDLWILLHELLSPLLRLLRKDRDPIHKILQRAPNLRQDQEKDHRQKSAEQEQRHHKADRPLGPAQTPRLFPRRERRKKPVLHLPHRNIDHKRNGRTRQKRRDQSQRHTQEYSQ